MVVEVEVEMGYLGSSGIRGHVVFTQVWCGVAGAPLPTEIRLISQELPEDRDVHIVCGWDARFHVRGNARMQ